MPLPAGTRLGPYEVSGSIGAGGMGEVYRARDTRLGREVAIKVLAEAKARDPEALIRFEQEARSASALNHPNIITIYDVGQCPFGQDSISYIAMELVTGRSIRQIVSEGPLPLKQFLNIAVQLAEALAAAHGIGIVHRDLKPENIMLGGADGGEPGLVKILDFGLAKLETSGSAGEKSGATATLALETQPGTILGTAAYMSPQQASGQAVDFRADQFSLGAILYEMATGKRAFSRLTGVETMVAVLREEPESIGRLNPTIPLPLQWTIKRCLAKKPEDRFASTRDLARDLAIVRDRLSEPGPESPGARRHNLPTQRTPLVGREKALSAAKQLLLRRDVRLVTFTGPGGTGKTRLALQIAEELLEYFAGGVYFVPLASIADPGLVAPTIAQTLGVRETAGKTLIEDLKEHLQHSHHQATLLLLDNFEQVASAAPLVAGLLEASAAIKILATSRAVLHVYGEHEFPVPPLALPDLNLLPDVETLSRYPAVALFLQRATALKPDFGLTQENVRAVAEICARLDGLPLAIELAAARIKLLPPPAMLARLQSRLQLLTGGSRDLPERQQTLRAAVGWSYELLNDAEQKLFRRLSVFVSGCTLEAAEAVSNAPNDLEADPLDGIASLADKSLLQQSEPADGEARFGMLETIREFALDRLAASGEDTETRRAHAAYCLVLAEEGGSHLAGPERRAWLNRFDLEQDNFRAALEWLTRTSNAEWGLRLGSALWLYWQDHAHPAEGRDRLRTILNLPGAAAQAKTRARALLVVMASTQQMDPFLSRLAGEQAMRIYQELGDKAGVATTSTHMAVAYRDQGNFEEARALFEETIRMWEEAGDPVSVAHTTSNLADVVRAQGDYETARSLHRECLSIFRRLGDRAGMAWSLNHQGDVAREQGDPAAAGSLYDQALAMFRELEDRTGIARSLTDLGILACQEGRYARAQRLYAEALALFCELGETKQTARVLEYMACAAAGQELWDRALRVAGAAASLRIRLGFPLTLSAKADLDRSLEPARVSLTTSAAATAWMEGSSMPPEKAIEFALASAAE
jgi:predicted ATPase/serine/threonine protein kinase/Tfp pilus assembly protein PilF